MIKNRKIVITIFTLILLAFLYQITITGFATNNRKNNGLYCTDSDKGENPLIKGTTVGYHWSWAEWQYKKDLQIDKCIPFDLSAKNRVREYYCNGFDVARKNIRCPEGTRCQKGACIKYIK